MRKRLRGWPAGRWFLVVAVVVGGAFLLGDLLASHSVFGSFKTGAIAAFIVMVLLGVGQNLYEGRKVTDAQAGGWGLGFGATKRAVAELNARVDAQMTEINRRLYDLDKAVFKDREEPPEREE
jgi:hypothetical protein